MATCESPFVLFNSTYNCMTDSSATVNPFKSNVYNSYYHLYAIEEDEKEEQKEQDKTAFDLLCETVQF